MKLVVGLGNPGKQYERTRHNVGFMVLDQLVDATNWKLETKQQATVSKQGDRIFMKPLTYMNSSGEAVRAIMQYYHITVTDLLVVFDDKDLPLGTIRFRTKGSSGGHNGIKSIIHHIGSEDFARFKIGIAPTDPQRTMGDTADYVLGKFSRVEQTALADIIKTTAQKVNDWCQR
jgi:PTH1 family peptidyl-tRNA hydrolase